MYFLTLRYLKCFSICLISLVACSGILAAQTWTSYTDTNSNCSFQLSGTITTVDSIHTKLYSAHVDSLLGINVILYDSAYLDANEELLSIALQQTSGDTLRAVSKLILLATSSSLTSIQNITVNNHLGLELGIAYDDLESNVPTLSFIRYFIIEHKFYTFIISGSSSDLSRLLNYRDSFFNSIQL